MQTYAPTKKPDFVTVTLTLPEVDVVLQSMGRREYDTVADLISNIRFQVFKQIDELNKPADPPADPPANDEKAGGTD